MRSRKKTSRTQVPSQKSRLAVPNEPLIEALITPYSRSLLLLLLTVIAFLSTWQLWEQDIFWQIRAGDEILSGMGLQTVDTWSFTAAGRPWMNFQWLATVIIRMAYGLGHEGGLVVFRALCALVLFSMMAGILGQGSKAKSLYPSLILLPWIFLCIAFKIEMRSDLFNFILFATLIALWPLEINVQRKRWSTIICCLIAVNLHAGTAPFVILLSCFLLMSDTTLTLPRRAAWSVVAALTMLANPYGYKIFGPIKDIFFYSKTNLFDNYDHYPLMFGKASLEQFGIAAWAWSLYAACAALAFVSEAKSSWKTSRWTWVLALLTGCILTALSINRMRAIPYHVLFFLPYMGRATSKVLALQWGRPLTVAAASLLLYGFVLQEKNYPLQRGLSLSPAAWPIGSARFIAATKPQGHILHTWGYGGYFVWHLRDYPTFGDPREAMFWDLQPKMLAAQGNPETMRLLCREYNINIAVIPTPAPQFSPEANNFVDGLSVIFPQSAWALVYFDDISTILVRRVPEHETLIRQHEFTYLKPQLPANFYQRYPNRDIVSDTAFQNEVQRCRANEPMNVICRVAQSNLWRKAEKGNRLEEARALLEEVKNHPTTQKFEYLMELQAVYQKPGIVKQ